MGEKYSALQWMGPQLVRHGLLTNDDWIPDHAAKACAMFPNQGMHLPATLLAILDFRALDYLREAPILTMAAMMGGSGKKHDDDHGDGQLALAAAAYAYAAAQPDNIRRFITGIYSFTNLGMLRDLWPWEGRWWKAGDRRRELVKAGALIVAEIERLDRASPREDAA